MPENNLPETSVLLPQSRVVVFSEDDDTLAVARALAEDWRFARVEIVAERGPVEAAIAYTGQYASPDLVIVQTDAIDDGFAARLENLAGNCDEGTAAIVIGPVNDVYLYRKLVDMGVSDYLVKPMTADILGGVIAKTLISRRGVSGSRLIGFIGAKGGIGTTALAQALAWGVSDIMGQKTLLMDLAAGWSSMGVGMGFEPVTTLGEAVKAAVKGDQDSLKRMLFKASDKLDVLAHGGDDLFEPGASEAQVETLLDMMLARTPVVIADLSQSPVPLRRVVLSRANLIVMTTTPLLSSLRLARSLYHEIKELRGGSDEAMRLLVTMQGANPALEVPAKDIAQALDFKPSGAVPYDPRLFLKSENDASPLIKDSHGLALVKTILFPLVQNIIAAEGLDTGSSSSARSAGLLGGFLGKFSGGK